KAALDELKEGETVRGATAAPEWVALVDALCRFDSTRLKKAADDGPYGDTAALFHFLTVENTKTANRSIEAGQAVLKRVPECYRVHDASAETGGVAAQHRTTVAGFEVMNRTLRTRVGEMPELPPAVAEALKPDVAEPDLVAALAKAGASREDKGE